MGLLGFFSNKSGAIAIRAKPETELSPPAQISSNPASGTTDALNDIPSTVVGTAPPVIPAEAIELPTKSEDNLSPKIDGRRFSFRNIAFRRGNEEHKSTLTTEQDHEKKNHAATAFSKHRAIPRFSASDKRAKQSALLVRSVIIGRSATYTIPPTSPSVTKAVAKPQLSVIKAQLLQPNTANRVIAQLRTLPAYEKDGSSNGPIHAVCLSYTDEEEHKRHFSQLHSRPQEAAPVPTDATVLANVATASIETLTTMFNNMHLINLVTSPDLGLGQPGDGDGVLAGAVPTAETVIKGIEQITPQLMALGYATGNAALPDHKGIYPPTDRMSVLTYWWGLEIVLPHPSVVYLSKEESISNAVINFLSALALIDSGVREILPFIRYIGQFIDFEFDSIKKQDKGKGVVCAATWIMPAAMVPRPWDFLPPPKENKPSNFEGVTVNAPVKVSNDASGRIPSLALPPTLPSTEIVDPLKTTLPEVVVTSPSPSA